LQEYVTAASFSIFGQTTWAGRAPFAFIGWLAVMALGVIAWKIYKSHRVTLAAMALLGTSEAFLLHIRQCRYYSITVLAEILLVYGIYQILAKKKSGAWLVSIGLCLQFYCNYTTAAANVPILLILAWMLFRQNRRFALPVVQSLGILVLVSTPWLLFSEVWREGNAEVPETKAHMAWFYIRQFHFYIFPWCIVLLPALGLFFARFSKGANALIAEGSQGAAQRFEKYLFLLPFLYLPVLLVMPGAHLRYLLPVLPGMCLLVAVWLFRYIKWTAIAIIVLVLQCCTNVFALASAPFSRQYSLRSPLVDFVLSNLRPYDDRFSDVCKFFKAQAQPGQTLMSWDAEFPLIFYTPLKVINVRLAPPPSHPLPDWILLESPSVIFSQPPVDFPDFLKPYYDTITLTVHDSIRADNTPVTQNGLSVLTVTTVAGNIPDPDSYQYQTGKIMSSFVIYKLKTKSDEPAR
ncbi:MAG TPA: glycosyltransferase family 39 protein, partial [Pseudomonadales bacterium]|nr:glycosyltransferase family 39 protein [Pseudomonadales bacterium]